LFSPLFLVSISSNKKNVKVFVVALQQNSVSVRKAYAVFVARAWFPRRTEHV